MLPLCRADGIGVIPWSPLGGGKLTRPWGTKTDRSTTDMWNKSMYDDAPEDETAIVAAVERIADARNVSMAEVAMAWLLQKEPITAPIVGVSKAAHVKAALGAVDLDLGAEEIAGLEAMYKPHPVRGFQ